MYKASLVAKLVKNPPAMQETRFDSWVGKIPWRRDRQATHSRIFAWRIPWIEDPGRLQSMELQRVRHYCATSTLHKCVLCHSVVSDSFATPWTVVCQTPLSMGFSRQEYWSREPLPSPGDLPNPGIKPRSPALQAHSQILYHLSHKGSPTGK